MDPRSGVRTRVPAPASGPGALLFVLGLPLVLALAASTQTLAYRAGFHPALGEPLLALPPGWTRAAWGAAVALAVLGLASLGGRARWGWAPLAVLWGLAACVALVAVGPVYPLTAGARWTWRAVSAGGPNGEAALVAFGGVFLAGLAVASWAAGSARVLAGGTHGTAAWGDGGSLRSKGKKAAGLLLGRVQKTDLRYDGPGHLLTVAPTRAGKGVGAVIPALLSTPDSAVVTDPKGENYAVTAAYRRGVLGHRVVALDPFGLAPQSLFGRVGEGSVERGGLNPLGLIGEGSADAADDASGIAEMLVVEDGGGGDNRFWAAEAKALLAGLVLHVALSESGERRSLLTVRELLTLDADGFEAVVEKMKGSADAVVRRAGNRIDQKHDRERSAVVSTAQSHTHFLDSPRMASVLGRSTFDPSALRPGAGGLPGDHVWGDGAFDMHRPLSVYLLLPPDRLDAFSRWLRLVVATSITALAKLGPLAGGAPPAARRALFLLDEFAQLGAMPPVRRAFSLMAGYGVQVWPFLQDLGQLRRLYPKDWESFVANADVLQAFGTTDQFTAEYLSKMAGTATVFDQSTGTGRSRGKHTSRSTNVGSRETARALVTPDELRRLGRSDQVLLVRGEQPVLARRIAYYEDGVFGPRASG